MNYCIFIAISAMHMSMILTPTLEQKISMQHRLTFAQVQQISDMLRDLRNKIEPDDQRLLSALDQTFQKMSGKLPPELISLLSQQFNGMFFEKGKLFFQCLLEDSSSVVFKGRTGILDLTAKLIAKMVKVSAAAHELSELSEGEITQALMYPAQTDTHLGTLEELMNNAPTPEAKVRLSQEASRFRTMKLFYLENKINLQQIADFIEQLLGFPSEKENPLRRALVDIYLLDQAGFLVSERLLKRFGKVFSRPKSRLTFKDLKNGATNIIGEYMLVGMGVIDQDIFKVMSGEADYDEDHLVVDQGESKKIGELIRTYGLRNNKFFYSRYATLLVRPSQKTDDIIRDFLTNHVRAAGKELCNALGLQRLIDGFLADLDSENREESGENLMAEIGKAITTPEFRSTMSDIMKNILLPKLTGMLNGSSSVSTRALPGSQPPTMKK